MRELLLGSRSPLEAQHAVGFDHEIRKIVRPCKFRVLSLKIFVCDPTGHAAGSSDVDWHFVI